MATLEKPRAEVGTSGLKRWGTSPLGYQIQEEFLTDLQGRRGMLVYDEMRKSDPIIGGLMRATNDVIRGVKWNISPRTGRTPKFLGECMEDMSLSWTDFMSDVTTMIPFGWAWCETVFKQRNGETEPGATEASSDFDDGKIGWAKIALRGQDSLHSWDLDENGGILGMNQTTVGEFKLRNIPMSKSILFRTAHEKNNPEGASLLRPLYRPWYMKKNLEEIEGIGIERDFTGLMVITLPASATAADWNKANDILTRVKADEQAGITVQRGDNEREDWDVSLLSTPGGKAIDVDKAINRYATEITIGMLAQFLRLALAGTTGARGSSSLGTGAQRFFYVAISAIVDNIEDTVNRYLVPPLMRLNGIKKPWPKIKHGTIAPRDMEPFAQTLSTLLTSGLLGEVDETLAEYIRDQFELPNFEGAFKPYVPLQTSAWGDSSNQNDPAATTKNPPTGKAQGTKPVKTANEFGFGLDEDEDEDTDA